MKAQVILMAAQISETFLSPEVDDLYKITKISPIVVDNTLFFRVIIPLMSTTSYKIFRINPVPFVHNSTIVQLKTTHEYIATPVKRMQYQFLSQTDIAKCQRLRGDTILCSQPKHWLLAETSTCEWNLLMHISNHNCVMIDGPSTDQWYPLNEPNKWLFFMRTATKMVALCDDAMTHFELNGTGILDLNPRCEITNNVSRIMAERDFENASNEFIFPHFTVNKTSRTEITSDIMTIEHIQSNFTKINDQLRAVREQSTLPNTLNGYDLHHYSISTILFFLIIILAAIVIKYQKKKPLPIPAPRYKITEAISMPNLS